MTEQAPQETARAEAAAPAEPAPATEEKPEEERPDHRTMLLDSLGGWRGMIDSGLPVVVFVIANSVGGLRMAIWAAVICGGLLMAVRAVRRESVQQAISGFFGIAIAAFIASRTGEAKGFFLFGIWASFVYAGVFLVSVLVRWPAVGVIWEYVESGNTAWRSRGGLMWVYTWTTLVWTAVFLSRGIVQRFLYDEDRTGWLAFARIAMGYPLTLGALGITLLAVRRVRRLTESAPADGAPATA